MNRREPVSDALLEQMLLRRAHRADPGGLRQTVAAGVETLEPRRRPWAIDWRRTVDPQAFVPRPATIVLVLLLLLSLLASLAVGAGWLRRHVLPPIELTPTGIETITGGSVTWASVVEDGTGALWALNGGNVTQFDAATGAHRTWTVGEDRAFEAWPVTPARAGGVWIWSGGRLLRFTGDAFAETIPAPGAQGLLDEAPDGTLWAATSETGLVRWDGSRWLTPGSTGIPTAHEVTAILALGGADVWTASHDRATPGSPSAVAHFDGDRWSTFAWIGDRTRSPFRLADGSDGSIWAAREAGDAVRLHDGEWSALAAPGPARIIDVGGTSPDGALWVLLGGDDGTTRIGRYTDGQWTTYGPANGLLGTVGSVSATNVGVFAGTDQGLLQLDGLSWRTIWSSDAEPTPYGLPGTFIAVSRDEAWTADMRGVWHYWAGAWSGPIEPPGLPGSQATGLLVSDDGSLWVATVDGVAVRNDDRWVTAWDSKVLSIGQAADGSIWVGDFEKIVHLTRTATGFDSRAVPCPLPAVTLSVARDGTVWIGGLSYSGRAGLAHYDGTACETVDLGSDLPGGAPYEIASIVADPTGGVVVQAVDQGAADPTEWVLRLDDGNLTVLGSRQTSWGAGIAIDSHGDLWWARGRDSTDLGVFDLVRFDGNTWRPVIEAVRLNRGPIVITRDGAAWLQGAAGIERILLPAASSP